MIHIVGTNHELQHSAKPKRAAVALVAEARGEFQQYLRMQIQRLNPALVAEELVEEVLKCMGTESTVKAVAEEFGVRHQYCDPDKATRAKLGVPIGTENFPEKERQKYHNIREKYWYQEIVPFAGQTVLFVCGAEHVPSFRALLMENGCQVETLCEYWGKDVYGT